jgi:hypothetical protein
MFKQAIKKMEHCLPNIDFLMILYKIIIAIINFFFTKSIEFFCEQWKVVQTVTDLEELMTFFGENEVIHIHVILKFIIFCSPNFEVKLFHTPCTVFLPGCITDCSNEFLHIQIILDLVHLLRFQQNIFPFCLCRRISVSSKISTSADRLCVKWWTSAWCVSVSAKGSSALGNSCTRCSSSNHICVDGCFGQLHHCCSIKIVASRSPSHWQRYSEVRQSFLFW